MTKALQQPNHNDDEVRRVRDSKLVLVQMKAQVPQELQQRAQDSDSK